MSHLREVREVEMRAGTRLGEILVKQFVGEFGVPAGRGDIEPQSCRAMLVDLMNVDEPIGIVETPRRSQRHDCGFLDGIDRCVLHAFLGNRDGGFRIAEPYLHLCSVLPADPVERVTLS